LSPPRWALLRLLLLLLAVMRGQATAAVRMAAAAAAVTGRCVAVTEVAGVAGEEAGAVQGMQGWVVVLLLVELVVAAGGALGSRV
jgi:hypothetical protein